MLGIGHNTLPFSVTFNALARHLLEGADTAGEKPGGVSQPNASLSASVAIVIVISLVSVSLLITGIIIVAVTIDPSGGDDDSDIEWDSPRSFVFSYSQHVDESTDPLHDDDHDGKPNYFYSGQIFHEV
ncbi:unnamed protein product [Haemonchus placei]|uniref:AA_permease_C domain-containing protein n=1 Tax=Haemonchus placei TaxID=6290 RepID=A0A0N4WY35_HAEPC|nr:unnamed protein product [Haemonchus placei]